jgi:hypothetical protein
VPVETLREEIPKLTDDDFAFAHLFVDLGRRPGRPQKLKFVRS